jgi:4-hydroxy-tetrahydrodipicolinate synthase
LIDDRVGACYKLRNELALLYIYQRTQRASRVQAKESNMQLDELKRAFATVVAIPLTPFAADGSADFDTYARLLERMTARGIRVVTPNGNTSEFYSLTADEQRREVEVTSEAIRGQAVILAGVGYDAVTAAEMARFAASRNAHAVMVHQPVHPFKSDEGWIAYHKAIADAVPELAIVPYLRDATVRPSAIARLADLCPNFVAIKYAVTNPLQFAATVQTVGLDRLAWICGVAESWAPFFWPGGACGFTSGLVNLTTDFSLGMLAALEQGNYAQAMSIWNTVRPFEELRARHNNGNNVSVVKEAMAQMGLCQATVRPPISELIQAEKGEVSQILARLGLVEAVAA